MDGVAATDFFAASLAKPRSLVRQAGRYRPRVRSAPAAWARHSAIPQCGKKFSMVWKTFAGMGRGGW